MNKGKYTLESLLQSNKYFDSRYRLIQEEVDKVNEHVQKKLPEPVIKFNIRLVTVTIAPMHSWSISWKTRSIFAENHPFPLFGRMMSRKGLHVQQAEVNGPMHP